VLLFDWPLLLFDWPLLLLDPVPSCMRRFFWPVVPWVL